MCECFLVHKWCTVCGERKKRFFCRRTKSRLLHPTCCLIEITFVSSTMPVILCKPQLLFLWKILSKKSILYCNVFSLPVFQLYTSAATLTFLITQDQVLWLLSKTSTDANGIWSAELLDSRTAGWHKVVQASNRVRETIIESMYCLDVCIPLDSSFFQSCTSCTMQLLCTKEAGA